METNEDKLLCYKVNEGMHGVIQLIEIKGDGGDPLASRWWDLVVGLEH